MADAVLELIRRRTRDGSRPGQRSDGCVLCLAVEGGGMRGAVSAGMCVALEAAGLVPAFDRIYGVSAGALNAAATAAGQAALSSTHYEDAVQLRVVNPLRLLRGGPLIDYDLLFDEVIAAQKPLSFDSFIAGPAFAALATAADGSGLRVLRGFSDLDDLMGAIRASAFLPLFGDAASTYRGEPLLDGGLVEPLPFATALAEGGTHVLVLRSRPDGYRKPRFSELAERLAIHAPTDVRALMREQPARYNAQADALDELSAQPDAPVQQVAVPPRARVIRRLESDAERVAEALCLGAGAMARRLVAASVVEGRPLLGARFADAA